MREAKAEKLYKAYKFRLYPTAEQAVFFARCCGCSRYVYNNLLSDSVKYYEESGKHRVQGYKSLINEETIWLKEVDSFALCNAVLNLKKAFSSFFDSVSKGKQCGYPKYKSKKRNKESYTTNNNAGQIRFENGKLRLPKAGLVAGVFHTFVKGRIKSVNISRTKTGKWFASILTESEASGGPKPSGPDTEDILGIDLAFEGRFAVFSDGRKVNFPGRYTKSLEKLGKLQRQLARKEKGSNNREKLKREIAGVYERIHNSLDAFLEELSTDIARRYKYVVVEDVNLIAMAKAGHGKQILNESFGRFRNLLEVKLARCGGQLIKADKFYPSSQVCSACGFRNRGTKDLRVKRYVCPVCGTEHQRDENASRNLKNYGTAATAGIACGWDCRTCSREFCSLSHAVLMKQEKMRVSPYQPVNLMPSGWS